MEFRLNWSRWFHCESSFNLTLVPNTPGIFAIAEEVIMPRERTGTVDRHALNVVKVQACNDLFHDLNQLYSQDCPLRERLQRSRCFLRFAAVDDRGMLRAALDDLQSWLDSPGKVDSPFIQEFERQSEAFYSADDE
jgi:hypothetical protein